MFMTWLRISRGYFKSTTAPLFLVGRILNGMGGGKLPMWPFAAAMCRTLLPVSASIAEAHRALGGAGMVLRVSCSSEREPVRAAKRRSPISSSVRV